MKNAKYLMMILVLFFLWIYVDKSVSETNKMHSWEKRSLCEELAGNEPRDEQAIRICLKEAEGLEDSVVSMCQICSLYSELLGNEEETRRCMKAAEAKIDGAIEKAFCSETYADALHDYQTAYRLLGEAWTDDNSVSAWVELEKAYRKMGDEQRALQCIDRAEKKAAPNNPYEWFQIADEWSELGAPDGKYDADVERTTLILAEALKKQSRKKDEPEGER